MEQEIAYNIQYENLDILRDLAINEGIIDLSFDIEMERGVFVKPLLLAAIVGNTEVLELIL